MKRLGAALLIALCATSCMRSGTTTDSQSGQLVPPIETSPAKSWQEVLQELPFEINGIASNGNSLTDIPKLFMGTGAITPEELAAAFRKAGLPAEAKQFQVQGPPNMPAPTDTSPVEFAVITPSSVRSGQPLEIVVRVKNLSSSEVRLEYGVPSFQAVLVDKTGTPVRWLGGPWPMPLLTLTVAAKSLQDVKLSLPLNRFNPRLPLEPGEYAVKVAVYDVTLAGAQPKKLKTTVTGPVLNVTP